MQQYEITLQNEKKSSYKKSLAILAALNLAAFIILAWISGDMLSRNYSLFAAGASAVCITLYFISGSAKKVNLLYASLLIAAVCYLLLHYYGPAFIQVLVLFLYLLAVRELVVIVSDESISYPSFPRKAILWEQLNNLVLKDGILTIDHKNNKLVQQPVDDPESSINEAEFNDFCKKHLQPPTTEVI